MRCDYAHDDGAYVLGALAPAERAAYERHLATCPACREAVAEIAVLPGLLGRLDPAGLERIAPPAAESPVPALVAAARDSRRRERRISRIRYAGLVLVAACLAVVVGLGASWLQRPGGGTAGQNPQMTAMQPVRGAVPVTAEIGLDGTRAGTAVTMICHYRASANYTKAYPFRLVAYGPDGASEQVGSWVAGPGDEVTFTGYTRFTRGELLRLELVRYDNTPLLSFDVP